MNKHTRVSVKLKWTALYIAIQLLIEYLVGQVNLMYVYTYTYVNTFNVS